MEQTIGRRGLTARRFLSAVVLAGVLVALPATSEGATFRVHATSEREWKPDSLHIAKGSKVVWKNPTGSKHTLTAYKGAWHKDVTLSPGSRTHFVFKKRGTYKYRCTIHSTLSQGVCSGMCGKVQVN
jgi:plastocyanin